MSHKHSHRPDDIDFVQLRGVFDAPIAPAPRFAAQLKEELMAELTASDRIRPATSARATRDKGQITRVQTLTATNWQGALITIAAILTVLALSLASLRYVNQRTGGDGNDSNSGITSGQIASATPDATPGTTTKDGSEAHNQATFEPISPNLTEAPELYSANLPNVEQSMSVELFGDTLVRATGGNTSIEAIDIVSGVSLWILSLQVSSPIVGDRSSIYLTGTRDSGEFGLVAVDLATGREKWFVEDPSAGSNLEYVRASIVSDEVVYASDGASTYFAVDASSGAVLWDTDVVSAVEDGIFAGHGAFAVGDGHVYVASTIGSLVALDRVTGNVAWSTQYSTLLENGQIESDVVVGKDAVYVSATTWLYHSVTPEPERTYSSGESYASAFVAASGTVLWQSQLNTATRSSEIVNDVLLIDSMGMFETVDLATGNVLSSIKYTNNLQTLGEIRVSGNRAFTSGMVGSDLMIFEIDGHELVTSWKIPSVAAGLDHINVRVFAWQDGLLVLAPDGKFYRIAPSDEIATPAATSSPR